MHDIDRTQLETGYEANGYGAFGANQEFSGETYDEAYDEFEYQPEYETDGFGAFEADSYEFEGPFNEAIEMELAAEFLEVMDEHELDQFLGKIFRQASNFVRRAIPASVRRSLGGVLKNVARSALPIAGATLGNLVLPGIGGAVGGNLAGAAGRMFGLELEGLSPEDQEFEIARRYVRLVGEAAQHAASAPPNASPQAVAQRALAAAASKHAPGLIARPSTPAAPGPMARPAASHQMARQRRAMSGTWQRRGRYIIIADA